jgi:hypothetical protein
LLEEGKAKQVVAEFAGKNVTDPGGEADLQTSVGLAHLALSSVAESRAARQGSSSPHSRREVLLVCGNR